MGTWEAVAAAVEAACAVDVSALGTEELQAYALGVERASRRLAAKASEALGEVADRQPESAAHWWRDALSMSGEAAGRAVRRAAGLRSLPQVSESAVDGALSLEQAGAFVPLVGAFAADELAELEPLLVEGAPGRTVDAIQHWVRTLIAQHDEKDLVAEQERAQQRRFLKHRRTPDGMTRGSFALPDEDAEYVLTVLEALARRDGKEDARTAGQRRADALVAVFRAAAKWMDLPHAGGQRVQISYVMTCDWAAGLAGADPARGAWTGPQTRARMEAMLCDGRLSRLLLDAEGQVASLESVNDEITLAQRRAVSARDRCCVARGCTRPPAFCDVHHLISRKDGGPTVIGNLVLLCRRHHLMWHDGRLLLPDLNVPWLRKPLDPPMVA
jgi:hypothetical protein